MKPTIVVCGLTASLLVSCANGERPEDARADTPVRAETEVVRAASVTARREVPGTIRAETATILSSRTLGQILTVAVAEGDRVRRGQILAEIESREASAQVRRAEAAVAEAGHALTEVERSIQAGEAALEAANAQSALSLATLDRFRILYERNSVSAQEYDEVEARHRAAAAEADRARAALEASRARRLQLLSGIQRAEAEVDRARAGLEDTVLASPIDGVVAARNAEPGMLATPGMPLLTIEDDRTWEIEVDIAESWAGTVRVGQEAPVRIEALGATVRGRVRETFPAADPATRTYRVRLDLAVPEDLLRELRSGLFGRVSFPGEERQALLIPESALVVRGQLVGVYLVAEGRAVLRLIETGRTWDQGVEVLAGLRDGDRIVTRPGTGVAEGVPIEPAAENPE